MDCPLVISAPPQAGEYEVECVTTATTDHADPQWVYFYLKRAVGGIVRAPDIALANEVITNVWRDIENQLCTECVSAMAVTYEVLHRIRFPGYSRISVDKEAAALTADAVRDMAPGTVMYSRRDRALWVRGVGAPPFIEGGATASNIYMLNAYLPPESWAFTLTWVAREGIRYSDVCEVNAAASDEYLLK